MTELLPAFVAHSEPDSAFTIESDSVGDVGEYTLTLVSTIDVPTDYTMSQFETLTSKIELSLTVRAGCDKTSFLPWSLDGSEQLRTSVLGQPVSD